MKKRAKQIGLSLLLAPAAYADVTATIETGHDDNPFRLSDDLNNDEGAFIAAEVRLQQPLGNGFAFDGRVSHTAYDNNDQDADRTSYSATLEFESDSELFDMPAEFLVHARASGSDRTFVSRSTGDVGVFGGQQIADRFDHNSIELRGRVDFEVTEQSMLRLQLDARSRKYEDFTNLGLSNLDYNQVYAHARWRYQPTDAHDIRIGGSLGQRNHDDREGRDLNGNFVTGSNLDFTFFNANASWKYEFTDSQDVRFAYDFDNREDSVAGYFDTTRHKLALRYRYRPDKQNRFGAQIAYSDLEYDNIPASAIINNEENVGPNDGFSASLSYDRELFEKDDQSVWLITELTYDDFESPNPNFTYNRTLFTIGLKAEF